MSVDATCAGTDGVLTEGDDVGGGIGGAGAPGLSLLVQTGTFRPESLTEPQVAPDNMTGSIPDLPAVQERGA